MAMADEGDRAAHQDPDRLRQLLLDGHASEPGPVADDAFLDYLRDLVRAIG